LVFEQGFYHPADFLGKPLNEALAELHEEEARRLRGLDYVGLYGRPHWRVETNMPIDYKARFGTAMLHINADGVLEALTDNYDSSD
jgi:hypothetical protein